MQELIKKIEQWAIDRELDKKGTVESQSLKTVEEIVELIDAMSREDLELIKDGVGDVFVTLVVGNMLDIQTNVEKLYRRAEQLVKTDTCMLIEPERAFSLGDNIPQIIWLKYWPFIIVSILKNIMLVAGDYNLDFKDCVESAYKEIENRKGKIINGTFVKEEDLIDG